METGGERSGGRGRSGTGVLAAGLCVLLAAAEARAQVEPPAPLPVRPALGLRASWSSAGAATTPASPGLPVLHRPEDFGPAGLPNTAMPAKGEWAIELSQTRTHLDGLRDGTDHLSPGDVFALGYTVAPREMDHDLTALSVSWGWLDQLTLVLTLPWVHNVMRSVTDAGQEFTTRAWGPGDISALALIRLWQGERDHLHIDYGVSMPTGSTDMQDDVPGSGGASVKLPYPMQLGTGTLDFLTGLTWVHRGDEQGWGARLLTRFPRTSNGDGWRPGGRGELSGWYQRRVAEGTSASLRLAWTEWNDIRGDDGDLVIDSPAADAGAQGGRRVDLLLGLQWLGSDSLLGHRLALEVGAPVYQDLHGPQLETDTIATLSWRVAF